MSTDQILGLITGILFGFLLQKGRVLRFEKQVGAMLLKDMTIFKFMLSAILVGMVGIALLTDAGIITLSHKPMNLGAVLLGGALFGAGWAVMGFCPGTSIGALGEGRWHAVFAITGMVAGAALYAELFPFFKSTVLVWKDFGKIGLPETLGVSPWVIIPFFWAGTMSLFFWFEKKGL
ncbi:MAG: YeeE/YedE family protein [Deltaproteobacteria bacterium]|nr:YeeE/YedE family protein [Deltaproteobacteria bacterium]